jgi:hypothetical protein
MNVRRIWLWRRLIGTLQELLFDLVLAAKQREEIDRTKRVPTGSHTRLPRFM